MVVVNQFFIRKQIFNNQTHMIALEQDRITYIHWTQTQIYLENLSSDTNKIVTSRPEKVDTWQPPKAFEWVSVSRETIQGLVRHTAS